MYNRFLGICVLHGLIFLILIWCSTPERAYLSDSKEYLFAAENLVKHQSWYAGDFFKQHQPFLEAIRPPFFPLFLVLPFVFFSSIKVYWFLQCLVSCCTLFLLWKCAEKVSLNRSVQQGIMIIYICIPAQYTYMYYVMSEVLFQFVWISLLYLMIHKNLKTTIRFLFISIAAAATFGIKPVALLCVPVWLLYYVYENRKSVVKASMIFIFPLLVYGTIAAIHFQKTERFQYSSISGHNLVEYNFYYFLQSKAGKEYTDSVFIAKRTEASTMPYAQGSKMLESWAFDEMIKRPFSYALFHIRGMFPFFLDPGRFDAAQMVGSAQNRGFLEALSLGNAALIQLLISIPWQVWLYMVFSFMLKAVLLISCLYGLFYAFDYKSIPLPMYLAAFTLIWVAFLTGPLGASRFWLPFMPFQLLWAASTWNKNWNSAL